MNKRKLGRLFQVTGMFIVAAFAVTWVAFASDVDVAVVDVTAPTNSVTLAPGASDSITINMSVTGNQAGTATFEVYRDWTLAGGVFTGSNPEQFIVDPQSGGTVTTFTTTGTVFVDSGQTDGNFTLSVGAFNITNSNATGAKLGAGSASNYLVTVETPIVVPPADTTPPTIEIYSPVDGDDYTLGQVVYADYACNDEIDGSGVASCVGTVADGAAIDTSSVGSKTFTVVAEDVAGNLSTDKVTYQVVYAFDGFYAPINMNAVNSVKAGSAIPVKFSLAGNQGLDVLDGAPKVKAVSCVTGGNVDPIADNETVTAGKSTLQYDAASDQYTYVWKTDKNWANKCLQLEVTLVDGTTHTADFQFKK